MFKVLGLKSLFDKIVKPLREAAREVLEVVDGIRRVIEMCVSGRVDARRAEQKARAYRIANPKPAVLWSSEKSKMARNMLAEKVSPEVVQAFLLNKNR